MKATFSHTPETVLELLQFDEEFNLAYDNYFSDERTLEYYEELTDDERYRASCLGELAFRTVDIR